MTSIPIHRIFAIPLEALLFIAIACAMTPFFDSLSLSDHIDGKRQESSRHIEL